MIAPKRAAATPSLPDVAKRNPWLLNRLHLCSACGQFRSYLLGVGRSERAFPRYQLCPCDLRLYGATGPFEEEAPPPGFIANRALDLCHCCAGVVVPAGREASSWFCRACSPLVQLASAVEHERPLPVRPNPNGGRPGARARRVLAWAGGAALRDLKCAGLDANGENISLRRYVELTSDVPRNRECRAYGLVRWVGRRVSR